MSKFYRLDFLIALYIFCVAVSELLGSKTFPLLNIGGLHLTASVAIFVIPLMFTITDVVTEVHGRARARSLVGLGLMVIGLFLLFTLLATHLPASNRSLANEAAYDKIFQTTTRIAAASLIAFAVSGLLDILIFARLRQLLHNRALWLRNNVSNIISQLFDTTLFYMLAFYATNQTFGHNVGFLIGLIIPYWLIKCAFSALETPLVYLGVRWLKQEKQA